MAADVPESGTATTISAPTGDSLANISPDLCLTWWTNCLFKILSGLAKYTYSKRQKLFLVYLTLPTTFIPESSIIITSPGATSLTYLAPTVSRAQVSEQTMYDPFNRPKTKGRKPKVSRNAINLSLVKAIILNAP